MITLRPAEERGVTDLGWLDSRHTFSFGEYYDPSHAGFGPLRVINEDRVRPAAGFATHGHQDMEIISWVLEGALEHKDSIGTGSVIRPGEAQIMSAGTGIRHSEFNHSRSEPLHFLQIWILPGRRGLAPRYDQRSFPDSERRGRLRLIGSAGGRANSIVIHQNVEVYDTLLRTGDTVRHPLASDRRSWIQVVRGNIDVNNRPAAAGDGVAIEGEPMLTITSQRDGTEVLLFDLP